MKIRELLIRF